MPQNPSTDLIVQLIGVAKGSRQHLLPGDEEKRRSSRYNVQLPMTYQVLLPQEVVVRRHKATMHNLATGGMMFIAETRLSMNSICAFWITAPRVDSRCLAIAKIIWQTAINDGQIATGAKWIYWSENQGNAEAHSFVLLDSTLF